MRSLQIVQVHNPVLNGRQLTCNYTVDKESFTNSYSFPSEPTIDQSDTLTEKLCQWSAIVLSFGLFSIAYFDEIVCDFPITCEDKAFFEKLFYFGFGEFRYVNHLEITKKTILRGNNTPHPAQPYRINSAHRVTNGPLLLNGGGKDGSVSADVLQRASIDFTWFQRGNRTAQSNVVNAWNANVFIVQRALDPNRLNRKYAGHRPMSAGIAFLAVLAAHLFCYSDVIASNEASASDGNFTIDEFSLNHQYSKSFGLEQDLQSLLRTTGVPIGYFSLMRPFSELQIALLATRITKPRLAAFTSCNNGTKTGIWCMACAKCAFVVLVMTAADPSVAENIWGDQTTINKSSLQPYLNELINPSLNKPLECVGTLDECQLAARLILTHSSHLLEDATRDILTKFASTTKDIHGLRAFAPATIPVLYQPAIENAEKALRNRIF